MLVSSKDIFNIIVCQCENFAQHYLVSKCEPASIGCVTVEKSTMLGRDGLIRSSKSEARLTRGGGRKPRSSRVKTSAAAFTTASTVASAPPCPRRRPPPCRASRSIFGTVIRHYLTVTSPEISHRSSLITVHDPVQNIATLITLKT